MCIQDNQSRGVFDVQVSTIDVKHQHFLTVRLSGIRCWLQIGKFRASLNLINQTRPVQFCLNSESTRNVLLYSICEFINLRTQLVKSKSDEQMNKSAYSILLPLSHMANCKLRATQYCSTVPSERAPITSKLWSSQLVQIDGKDNTGSVSLYLLPIYYSFNKKFKYLYFIYRFWKYPCIYYINFLKNINAMYVHLYNMNIYTELIFSLIDNIHNLSIIHQRKQKSMKKSYTLSSDGIKNCHLYGGR